MTTAVTAALLLASLALTPALCRGVVVNSLVVFSGVWLVDLALYALDSVFGFFYVRLSEYAGLLLALSLLLVFIGAVLGLSWRPIWFERMPPTSSTTDSAVLSGSRTC